MSDEARGLVERGIAAAEAGRRKQAQGYFIQALALDANNEEAWLWRGALADDPQESVFCMERALTINPTSERAREGLRWAEARLKAARGAEARAERPSRSPSPRKAKKPPRRAAKAARRRKASPRSRIWVAALLVTTLFVALLILRGAAGEGLSDAIIRLRATPTATPTSEQRIKALWRKLDIAWADRDWPQAIEILQQVQKIDADYEGLKEKLFTAHFNYGVQLVRQEQLARAIAQFDEALKLFPNDVNASGERYFAKLYLEGIASYGESDWTQAIERFQTVYDGNPEYRDVRQRLYLSYYNYGLALQEAGELVEAARQYRQALQIDPSGTEARGQLDKLKEIVSVLAKKIEVDLSDQQLIAWEGDEVIYRFPCSTGGAAHPTREGTFEVLSKIPNAYSPSWRLHMPYWLGIYWVDSMENGIHALPIDSKGNILWAGYLGKQPVSLGCVILDTEAAKTLYNWAEIGTLVVIKP